MKTMIVVLTLLTLAMAATVALADGSYYYSVQLAWQNQQAERAKADQAFGRIFSDVAKSMASVPMPDLGTGWATAAAAGGGARGAAQVRGWTTCPGY